MQSTNDYLKRTFREDRAELTQTLELVAETAEIFPRLLVERQWPYEITSTDTPAAPPVYSQSTNAMILFAIVAATGRAASSCSLIIDGPPIRPLILDDSKWMILRTAWSRLLLATQQKRSYLSFSGSFGLDDPFTLTWLLELVRSRAFQEDRATGRRFKSTVVRRARERTRQVFTSLRLLSSGSKDSSALLLQWAPNCGLTRTQWDRLAARYKLRPGVQNLDHALPLLRYVNLAQSLRYTPRDPSFLKRYFEARAHEQLSKSEIRDGDFDPAELVFSIEAMLLLEPQCVNRSFLDRAFGVIRQSQDRNPYWRPVKPFVSQAQGQVLFPLSVETAHAMLRCCALVEANRIDPDSFSRNLDLFRRYVDWLRSRLKRGTLLTTGDAFVGWHSEHVHLHPGIHLWETSQVMLFLLAYGTMLDRHIARSAAAAAELTSKRIADDSDALSLNRYWRSDRRAIEPLAGIRLSSQFRIYARTAESFVTPRDPSIQPPRKLRYSLLLYGPPGTGKTTFAKEICRAMRWPLITVTPTDFIRGGESEVEARAKMVFDVLGVQSNMVILFDEIDRMVLDRDSRVYGRQSDIFQFMTPGMLTKLAELHATSRIIFILATNYEERIDKAAKRPGRLDVQLLLPPPDVKGRATIFQRLIGALIKKDVKDARVLREFNNMAGRRLVPTARNTRLMAFTELDTIVQATWENLNSADRRRPDRILEELSRRANAASPPEIKLSGYRSRFRDAKYLQRPWREFLVLLYIMLEDDGEVSDEDREMAQDLLKTLANSGEQTDWNSLSPAKRRSAVQQSLFEKLGDKQIARTILRRLFPDPV